ncbi:MAG: DoxX family protein [Holophagae bacterium]
MDTAVTVIQLVIALGIVNVWLLRFRKPTQWRGGAATNMTDEFATYGLPAWSVPLIGFLKLACAAALVAGIWVPVLVRPAAIGLAVLMLGALAMHVKVNDPVKKSVPAATMLVLCLIVAFG